MTNWRRIGREAVGRGVAGLVSLGTLGVAGYCTIKSDNEIGTAAAYLTGLFFAAIAYTGKVPRVKIGDNELEPAVAAALGAEVAAGAAQKAADESDDPKAVASAAQVAASNLSRSVAVKFSRSHAVDIVPAVLVEGNSDRQYLEDVRRRLEEVYGDDVEPPDK